MDAVLRILLQVVLNGSDIEGDELYGPATDREIEEIVAQGEVQELPLPDIKLIDLRLIVIGTIQIISSAMGSLDGTGRMLRSFLWSQLPRTALTEASWQRDNTLQAAASYVYEHLKLIIPLEMLPSDLLCMLKGSIVLSKIRTLKYKHLGDPLRADLL